MSLGKVEPTGLLIGEIIPNIAMGDVKIPAFQRGFVWTQDQVIALLDSIYNDFPIGSILLWSSKERLRSVRNIAGLLLPNLDPDYPVNYVLDGQQRLSVIYGVFAPDKHFDVESEEYSVNADIFEVYFDLSSKKFVLKSEVTSSANNFDSLPLLKGLASGGKYLKLSALFSTRELLLHTRQLDDKYLDLVTQVQAKFQSYKVPIVQIKNRTKEEVGKIFERINNTGTKLSTVDLMVAWTWSEDFHLRESINEIVGVLAAKGFEELPEKRILQCLSGIISQTASTEDILNLNAQAVHSSIKTLKASLEKTVDFLTTQLNVESIDFLPHSHQVVPLSYFFSNVPYPNREQRKILHKWFWATSFSRRYAGATDTRVNEDIEFFTKVLKDDYSDIDKYEHAASEEMLLNIEFSKNSPITRAFLLLLAQKEPRDLLYGNKVDVDRALSRYNLKEYHHIFPVDHLKQTGHSKNVSSICNFCFLPSNINKKVSNRAPSDYLFGHTLSKGLFDVQRSEYLDPSIRTAVFESNLLPLDESIYVENRFQDFLKERAKIVLEFLDSIIESVF